MNERKYSWIKEIYWNNKGLVPVITQDVKTHSILMFAWMNKDALLKTIESKYAVYYSRSRKCLWFKGKESGNVQYVIDIRTDCDKDVILMNVNQKHNISCHTGRYSCFFCKFEGDAVNGKWIITNPIKKL